MQQEEVLQRFKAAGALLEGHFVLTSGRHSTLYLQCALVLQNPAAATAFGIGIAERFLKSNIDAVVSPALGGIIIGYEVARQLGTRFIWTERENSRMTLRRGFQIRQGENVLVVEDVITTGGSTRETIEVVRAAGGRVVGAASIVDRSSGKVVGAPLFSLARLDIMSVPPDECEACRRNEVAIKPGSRN